MKRTVFTQHRASHPRRLRFAHLLLLVALLALSSSFTARATGFSDGDFTTYAQTEWPSNQTAMDILVAGFDSIYGSNGGTLEIGGGYKIYFDSAAAVVRYLPASGPPTALTGSVIDPTSTSSGLYGGAVTALRLNVDYSARGLLPGASSLHFCDLILTGFDGTLAGLNGMSVRSFLALNETALGGGATSISIDDLDAIAQQASGAFTTGIVTTFAADHLIAPPSQFANISGRADVGTGDNVGIAGFIILTETSNPTRTANPRGTTTTKRVLIRGIGPSLAGAGVPSPLADPLIELHDNNGAILASNDNWGDAVNASDIHVTGLAPGDAHESAILITLDSGNSYTVILRGAGDTVGIGLVEVYDLEGVTNTNLANISTRAFVSTGDDVLIGGMIMRGSGGQVLVRGMGPSLAVANVPNVLSDPQLDLYDGQGTHIAHNDNWKDSQETDIAATGFKPNNDNEAAILFTPAPANYTAIVSGVGGTTGVGLVEAYRFGPP